MGLFNIGAEGQMVVGSLAMAWVGVTAGGLPSFILVPLALLAGALAGGAWGALPGYLRARTGSHEVINTIMMNFIAMGIAGYLLAERLGVPQTLHTSPIDDAAVLPALESFIPLLARSPVNVSLFLAIGLAIVLTLFLWRTTLGLEIRAVGANPEAARLVGISPAITTTFALALGGALAGLSGANTVLGHRHFFEEGMGAGTGFMGIAVALVARNHPLAVLPAAFFFAVLGYGGLVINTEVPRELVRILQALVMIMILIAGGAGERLLQGRKWSAGGDSVTQEVAAAPQGESR
jgi:simple sugar transport system permease protein